MATPSLPPSSLVSPLPSLSPILYPLLPPPPPRRFEATADSKVAWPPSFRRPSVLRVLVRWLCGCLLLRFLCFYPLRSGQTIPRASIETLLHQRVAAAYIHWLIAANGIASHLATSRAGMPLLLLLLALARAVTDVTPVLGRADVTDVTPVHKMAKGWPIRSSTSEMASACGIIPHPHHPSRGF